MGEAKRRAEVRRLVDGATKHLVDEGKLIEAGWVSLKLTAYPNGMTPDQEQQLRQAFFAGAQHLIASICSFLEPDADITDKDLQRMNNVQRELDEFIQDYTARFVPTVGGKQ